MSALKQRSVTLGIVVPADAPQAAVRKRLPNWCVVAVERGGPEVLPVVGRQALDLGPDQARSTDGLRALTRWVRCPLHFVLLLSFGCAGPPLSIDLMPAPSVYSDAGLDPFADNTPIESLPGFSLLYATPREPAKEGDRERFYTNRRAKALRGGVARVEAGRGDLTWEGARRATLAKDRHDRYSLEITDVKDLGIIEASVFTPADELEAENDAADAFAALVNDRLAESSVKDVYVYVHGYKVVFEYPLLVASELWHFLGYQGVMIAFSWPSTPSLWAYFGDLETAVWSAASFRRLLALLAKRTDAERIHVVGYSAGTRLVTTALHEIALMHNGDTAEETRAAYRLGDVLLVGSDVDRQTMGLYIEDGLLKAQNRLTIYLSGEDRALRMSHRALGAGRTGETFPEQPSEEVQALLWSTDALTLVDVTEAEESDAGNGHAYFRNSPWASSDVLLTLATDLGPEARGLVRIEGSPVWTFPPDYVARLRTALESVIPGSTEDAQPRPH